MKDSFKSLEVKQDETRASSLAHYKASNASNDSEDSSSERAELSLLMPSLTIQDYETGPSSEKESSFDKPMELSAVSDLPSLESIQEPQIKDSEEVFVSTEEISSSSDSSDSEYETSKKKIKEAPELPMIQIEVGNSEKGLKLSLIHI